MRQHAHSCTSLYLDLHLLSLDQLAAWKGSHALSPAAPTHNDVAWLSSVSHAQMERLIPLHFPLSLS
jgi:hypothetical protein